MTSSHMSQPTSPGGHEATRTSTHRLEILSSYRGALRVLRVRQGPEELLSVTLRPLTPAEDNQARAAVITAALGTQGLIDAGQPSLLEARAYLAERLAPNADPELTPWPAPAHLASAGLMRILRLTHRDPEVIRGLFPSASDIQTDRGDLLICQPLGTLLPDVPLPWVKRQITAVMQGGLVQPFEATLLLRAGQQTWGVPLTAFTLTNVLAAVTAHVTARITVTAYPTTHGEGYVARVTPALNAAEQALLDIGAHGACLHVAGLTGPTLPVSSLHLP